MIASNLSCFLTCGNNHGNDDENDNDPGDIVHIVGRQVIPEHRQQIRNHQAPVAQHLGALSNLEVSTNGVVQGLQLRF